ncbi:MAG: nucleotidyltransferase family protein, partial [Pseudomonadota bacterium]
MLSIGGRPVLECLLAWLKHYGIREIAVNLHYRPEAITDYFGDGTQLGVRITYSPEREILGTAGGTKNIERFFDSTFVVVYGDILTDFPLPDLVRFHSECCQSPHMTMGLYHVPNPTECGIVVLDDRGQVVRFAEKPDAGEVFSDLANTGVIVLDREILEYVPAGRSCDYGKDVLPALLARGVPVYGWTIPSWSYLIDIGTPEKFARASSEWPTTAAVQFLDAWIRS